MITKYQNEQISQKMSRFLIKSNLNTVKLPYKEFKSTFITTKKNVYQKNLSGSIHVYRKKKGYSDLLHFGNSQAGLRKSKSVKNSLEDVFQQKINFADNNIKNLNIQQQHVLNDKKKIRLKRDQIQNKIIEDHQFKKYRLEQICQLRKNFNFFEEQYSNQNKSLQIQLKREKNEIKELKERVEQAIKFYELLKNHYDKQFTF